MRMFFLNIAQTMISIPKDGSLLKSVILPDKIRDSLKEQQWYLDLYVQRPLDLGVLPLLVYFRGI